MSKAILFFAFLNLPKENVSFLTQSAQYDSNAKEKEKRESLLGCERRE